MRFKSPGGRHFHVAAGADEHGGYPVRRGRKRVGTLWNDARSYPDNPWRVSTRQLAFAGAVPPTGIGFDGSPKSTRAEALADFGRIADEVLDWRAGKKVRSIYSKTGFYQKAKGRRR